MITKKKKAKARKQSKREFTQKTRLFDLVRNEHHADLRQLVEELRPVSVNGDALNWKTLSRLEVDLNLTSKTRFIYLIATFLHRIGKGCGLKCRMSTFIRWLSSTEHSNFFLSRGYVNKLIYNMLAYIEGTEIEQEN